MSAADGAIGILGFVVVLTVIWFCLATCYLVYSFIIGELVFIPFIIRRITLVATVVLSIMIMSGD